VLFRDDVNVLVVVFAHGIIMCCSASVLDRLNALLEPNGCLSLSERGVIDGAVPTVSPHPEFRYEHQLNVVMS